MAEFIDSTFRGGRVPLDGQRFVRCMFKDAKIVFTGLAPVIMEGCSFENVEWVFEGPAALTVNFLRALYQGGGEGGRKLVEATFEQIRKPLDAVSVGV